MSSASRFGAILARIRREQGFKSAHLFYRSRDGRRNLGLSYANYVNLERGKSLPKSWRLKDILRALGLLASSPQARELLRAYLAAALDSEELVESLLSPEGPPEALNARQLIEDAARQSLKQRAVQLSLDQWRAIAQDAACYTCYVFMTNTPGWIKIADLGRFIGLPPGSLKRALQELSKAGVAEVSDDRVRSPLAQKMVTFPKTLAAASGLYGSMYNYRQDWINKRAKLAHLTALTVRMEKKSLERYRQQLADAVHLSAVYGDVERTEDTSICLVEGRIYDVFP